MDLATTFGEAGSNVCGDDGFRGSMPEKGMTQPDLVLRLPLPVAAVPAPTPGGGPSRRPHQRHHSNVLDAAAPEEASFLVVSKVGVEELWPVEVGAEDPVEVDGGGSRAEASWASRGWRRRSRTAEDGGRSWAAEDGEGRWG